MCARGQVPQHLNKHLDNGEASDAAHTVEFTCTLRMHCKHAIKTGDLASPRGFKSPIQIGMLAIDIHTIVDAILGEPVSNLRC